MNWYWVISGILMIVGGLMHTVVGEKNVISYLAKNKPTTGFSPDQTFNLIRWFWYLGSFISFWVGGIALLIGAADGIIPEENFIGRLLASLMFGFSIITFGAVAILNPKELAKLSQVVILVVVTILLWLGASVS
ncbi:MAG: hypothetical protein AAF702_21160 [Chloroflexota bacterium]